jgi:hypothetical protein
MIGLGLTVLVTKTFADFVGEKGCQKQSSLFQDRRRDLVPQKRIRVRVKVIVRVNARK